MSCLVTLFRKIWRQCEIDKLKCTTLQKIVFEDTAPRTKSKKSEFIQISAQNG